MVAGSSSLVFRLFGEDISASRTLARVGAEAEATSSKFGALGAAAGKALAGVGLAAGVVAGASVDLAMKFDQSMTRISTLANVPQAQLKGLSDQVLGLAGQVGFSPTSLAQALYHVESSFQSLQLKGFNAMDVIKTAAKGAAIGGADLVETTNALDALLATGAVKIGNYSQAMSALLATVGSGDMQMQDLVEAFNGMQSIGPAYGTTLADMSAALATFGDNNIRGAEAGTAFRMALMSLAVPAKTGKALLEQMGMTQHTLAQDMQQGGLNKALLDLHDHLTKIGVTGPKVGEALTELFGKRAGVGLSVLYTQLDRFESKYKDVAAQMGPNSLNQKWEQQQKQFSQQMKDLEYGAEAVGIRIGNFLIPQIMRFGKAVGDAWHNLNQRAGGQQSIFKEFMVGFNNPGMTNFDSGFGGALEKIGVSAHKLGGEISRNLKPVLNDFRDFTTNSLLPALSNLWTALSPTVHRALHDLGQAFHDLGSFIKNDAGPWLQNVTQWMADHKQVVKAFADVTLTLLTAWAGYTVWVKASAAAKTLTTSLEALKVAASTPAGKFAFIGGLAFGMYELYKTFEPVRRAFILFATDVIAGIDGIVVAFKAMVDFVADGVVHMVNTFSKLPGPLGAPWRAIKHAAEDFKTTMDKNSEAVIKSLDKTNDHLTDLMNGIHNTTVSTDGLKKSIEGLPNKTIIVDVIDNASSILNDIHNAAASLINLGFTPQGATNTIKASNFASGGPVVGPGGPRDDAIPARLSNGEFVVNAAATSKNLGLLHAINAQGFADGGLVYDATPTVRNMGNILHSGVGGPGGMSSGSAVNLGRVMAAAYGWVGAMFDALNKLWTRESGWNPNAVNPSSGAYGIPQALGHGHPFNLGDAGAQIAWGLAYIAGRYGNPINAWAHETQVGWYAKGGMIPAGAWGVAGEAGPELVRGPARVYSNADSRRMLGSQVVVNITGPVYSDSAGIKRLMSDIDREIARSGNNVPPTFRRR